MCPSSSQGAPFWPSGLTLRSSGLAFRQPLTLAVSTKENPLYSSPCLFKRHSTSQVLFSAGFVVSLGFACWLFVSFWSFWPPALVQQAQAAIVVAALCSLGGAALFPSSCPSPNPSYRFGLLALTFRSSRPAFCGRLTSPVSPLIFLFMQSYIHSSASPLSKVSPLGFCHFNKISKR